MQLVRGWITLAAICTPDSQGMRPSNWRNCSAGIFSTNPWLWLSAPFRKYLNVFIDPTCGWLRTVAQMRGLAYRSIPFRQAGGAAAYLAGPTDLPPSRRSVSFPDHAPLPTPPPPATHGPFPRAAP